MLLLVDCSDGITVALESGAVLRDPNPTQAMSATPLMTGKLLKDSGLTFADITGVAVVVGPGSFTGIRIGIAFAKGIGLGGNIPVVPLNRFEIAAYNAKGTTIAIDNKKDGFFVAVPCAEPQIILRENFKTDENIVLNPEIDTNAAFVIAREKLAQIKATTETAIIPMYLKPHYAEGKEKYD